MQVAKTLEILLYSPAEKWPLKGLALEMDFRCEIELLMKIS